MNTRETIVHLTDQMIRDHGFNAFSFKDLSKMIGIKTASIHYHFPTKADLGVATVSENIYRLEALKKEFQEKAPLEKLEGYFSIYSKACTENKICIVGSLATDFHTLDEKIRAELARLSTLILDWVVSILEEGKAENVFHFSIEPRTKALMIITNMLAIVQLVRLTGTADFELVTQAILGDLGIKK